MPLLGDITSRIDDPYLAHACALALRARGRTAPNPLVGCVVVADGRIVGEGFHPRAGEAHAEVFALADAGPAARGAEVYVTLEPCAHHGRTPPCADALIAAGVSRVVIGMRDPNAEAAGGAKRLAEAGIEVAFASDPAPFAELNAGWLKRLATGMPRVIAKVGVSLDGKIALTAGERASMTGAGGSRVTMRLRDSVDAVLVSAATVAADDPSLTVRDASGTPAEHQPLRVVLARKTMPPTDAALLRDQAAPTLVLAPQGASLPALPPHVVCATYEPAAGLRGALAALGARGVSDLLVEPGPRLLAALASQHLIDELVVVTAGGFAGDSAPSLFAGDSADAGDGVLRHSLCPAQTGIVDDVSFTVWRPCAADEDQ